MTPLFGHDAAVAAFRAALDGGRLHHAWLLAGPEGVGKALFADKAALRVLAEGAGPPVDAPGLDVPDDHPTARLVAAGSHPDLMRLERLTQRRAAPSSPASITVDQVRGLQRLFATTASMSPWRAVVIDAVDDLERNAANALLKNLEEPPPSTLFLLVSHAPERLLPTIRSRCRLLRLSPLDDDAMTSALRAALPDADEDEIAALVEVGEGAPGPRHRLARARHRRRSTRRCDALVARGRSHQCPPLGAGAEPGAQVRPAALRGLPRPRALADRGRRRRSGGAPALAEALALWERAIGARRQRAAPFARPAERRLRAGRDAGGAGAGRKSTRPDG